MQALLQCRVDGICNVATEALLQFLAAFGFLQAALAGAEVGRSAHALIESEASVRQANDPPELLSIEQLPAGHAAPEDAA